MKTVFRIRDYREAPDAFPEIPGDLLNEAIHQFLAAKEPFYQKVQQAVDGSTPNDDPEQAIRKVFDTERRYLDDMVHAISVTAIRAAIEDEKVKQYRFIAADDDSCAACLKNDQKIYVVEDAQEGINYPLMHPNCRCTIAAYAKGLEADAAQNQNAFERVLAGFVGLPRFLQEHVGPILEYIDEGLRETVWDTIVSMISGHFGSYTKIKVNHSNYRFDKSSFSGVTILPNGQFAVPENVTDIDRELLKNMKLRDQLEDSDPRKLEQLRIIHEIANQHLGEYTVDIYRPYSFYELGEDVTSKLHGYMQSHQEMYSHMQGRASWLLNLNDFYGLVRNNGEMDLKNQKEWQKSAFIYEGEIVSQDALGNINYGYFDKLCGIPDVILAAGAGYAQITSGTSDPVFLLTFGDDPRDQMRILQGVAFYNYEQIRTFLP